MPYTGNLVRMAQAPDARRLPPPSPRHGENEGDPSASRAEHVVPTGTGSEYQGADFQPVIMSGWGMQLDTPASWAGAPPGGAAEEPYRITYARSNPHDSRAVLSAAGADTYQRSPALRVAAHDGAQDHHDRRVIFDPSPFAGDSQHREEIDTDGLAQWQTSPDGEQAKYVRGINSLGTNNPGRIGYDGPGFRRGRERVRAWDNTVRAHISRTFGSQMLQPCDAYTPNPARQMVSTYVTEPALPRSPSSPDDPMTARTNYVSAPASTFGGF